MSRTLPRLTDPETGEPAEYAGWRDLVFVIARALTGMSHGLHRIADALERRDGNA